MTDLESLQNLVRRQWNVRTKRIQIGDWSHELWMADVDEALDAYVRHPEGGEPYWAECWDIAEACMHDILSRDLEGARVLDIGCGVGATGAAAAFQGARVHLVDHAANALPFATINTWPWRDRVEVAQADWKSDVVGADFDLIIGSDILYDAANWPFLEAFFRRHISPAGEVLLGEADRFGGRGFDRWANEQGWSTSVRAVEHGRLITCRIE